MKEYRGYYIYNTFSADDGGYCAEVSNSKGETVYVTEIYNTHYKPERVARKFIDKRRSSIAAISKLKDKS